MRTPNVNATLFNYFYLSFEKSYNTLIDIYDYKDWTFSRISFACFILIISVDRMTVYIWPLILTRFSDFIQGHERYNDYLYKNMNNTQIIAYFIGLMHTLTIIEPIPV